MNANTAASTPSRGTELPCDTVLLGLEPSDSIQKNGFEVEAKKLNILITFHFRLTEGHRRCQEVWFAYFQLPLLAPAS